MRASQLSLLALCAALAAAAPRAPLLAPGPRWVTAGAHAGAAPPDAAAVMRVVAAASEAPGLEVVSSGKGRSLLRCEVVGAPDGFAWAAPVAKMLDMVDDAWASKVEVRMRVGFADLGGEDVLATGGGTHMVEMDGGELVPVAAAEAMTGRELNGGLGGMEGYDVLLTVNTGARWYTGTDGLVPEDQYDFVTVLMHEVYHSLMFMGAVTLEEGRGAGLRSGFSARFDAFLSDAAGCRITGYLAPGDRAVAALAAQTGRAPPQLFADALTNSALYFTVHDERARQAVRLARLSAPEPFVPKSSVYHLDESETGDALMAPSVQRGRAVHVVGEKIRAMQAVFLDSSYRGAVDCAGVLGDPLRAAVVVRTHPKNMEPTVTPVPVVPFQTQAASAAPATTAAMQAATTTAVGGIIADGNGASSNQDDGGNKVAGLDVWAFVLVILFSIIAVAILIGLIVLLCRTCLTGKPAWNGYTYYSRSSTSRTKAEKTQVMAATGSGGGSASFSENVVVDEEIDNPAMYEGGGAVVPPAQPSSSKKTTCKKTSTKPTTTICKSKSSSRHHSHHHHGHHHHGHRHHHHHHKKCHYKYTCHCCKCKGRHTTTVAAPSSRSSSSASSAPPPPTSMQRKCCPCRNCKNGSTIRIKVIASKA